MKLVIDEKLKHRLIGVAVIISLGAIFAPAMMKKSSQNMENNYSVHVKLPPKPEAPNVALSDEKEVFKTIKIAKVKLSDVSSESKLPELAKAERLQRNDIASREVAVPGQNHEGMGLAAEQLALNKAAQNTVKHEVQVASVKPKSSVASKPAQKASTVALTKPQTPPNVKVAKANIQKPASKTELYAVQLASFSQLSNAQSLVNKLRSKGYKASFTKVSGRDGAVYKVFVGHSPRKMEVMKLKTQLANAMQLNGFVVNTGVS